MVSKVIIEAALLDRRREGRRLHSSEGGGADFVKTSTGFASGGATAADVALMRRVVGAEMGVKAAGGVRDLEGLQGDGRGRRDASRRQRRRQDRPGIEGAGTGDRRCIGLLTAGQSSRASIRIRTLAIWSTAY